MMSLADAVYGDRAAFEAAFINPFLDSDMRCCLELQIALLGVMAIVAL